MSYGLDWSNPFTKGLRLCWLPEMGVTWRNRGILENADGAFVGTQLPWVGCYDGYAVDLAGSDSRYLTGPAANALFTPSDTEGTVLLICTPDSGTASKTIFMVARDASGNRWSINHGSASGQFRTNYKNASDVTQNLDAGASTHVVGKRTVVAMMGRSSDVRIFIDGTKRASASNFSVANTIQSSTADAILVGRSISTTFAWDGKVHACMVWNRALSDEEVGRISVSPYQIVRPDSPGWWGALLEAPSVGVLGEIFHSPVFGVAVQ